MPLARRIVYVFPIAVRYIPRFVIGRSVCMLSDAQTRLQEAKPLVHNTSTKKFGYSQFIDTCAYGCIVVTGVGDAETTGDTIGDGVITCARLCGDADGDGDIVA